MSQEFNATLMMLTLLRATAKYVYPRITTYKLQLAYKAGIDLAIGLFTEECENSHGLTHLKKELGYMRDRQNSIFPRNFFNKREDEIEYFNKALDHAIEIVFKLEARFITGEGDREPRNYRGKFIHLYNQVNEFD